MDMILFLSDCIVGLGRVSCFCVYSILHFGSMLQSICIVTGEKVFGLPCGGQRRLLGVVALRRVGRIAPRVDHGQEDRAGDSTDASTAPVAGMMLSNGLARDGIGEPAIDKYLIAKPFRTQPSTSMAK